MLVHGSTRDARDSVSQRRLKSELAALRADVLTEGRATFEAWRPRIERRAFLGSGYNLATYLALRRRDLRALQLDLMAFGLSSLGRCEARVVPNLDAVLRTLELACGDAPTVRYPTHEQFFRGERLLGRNIERLFNPAPQHRHTRIMVTLPSSAAVDGDLIEQLVTRGMDCARINCAHDGAQAWLAMIGNVRRASARVGRLCSVCADLGGPKIRTARVTLVEGRERVVIGDRIFLSAGDSVAPAADEFHVICSPPEIVKDLRKGEPVWIDDGRIQCTIEELRPGGVVLSVRGARAKGEKLRPEKGLNFSNSALDVAALTKDDLAALDVLADAVDMFGYSFVAMASDVAYLQAEIVKRRSSALPRCGIILKIETAKAVKHLPELIVESAGKQPTAVMIARGDLAVEIGYRRLAEIQEEILWLCEAAHVPVVWATQVLDNFVKKGIRSRAEFTDAAMAERADCVMLNKGPFVTDAVSQLDDLLGRMEAHQTKKTSRLRALHSW